MGAVVSSQTQVDHAGLVTLGGKIEDVGHSGGDVRGVEGGLDHGDLRVGSHALELLPLGPRAVSGGDPGNVSAVSVEIGRGGGLSRGDVLRVKVTGRRSDRGSR